MYDFMERGSVKNLNEQQFGIISLLYIFFDEPRFENDIISGRLPKLDNYCVDIF